LSKPALINQLKEKNPNLNKSEIETIIQSFLRGITLALQDGRSVELRNFGKFYLRRIKENFRARNPKTNEIIYKPERVKIKFKASSNLNKILNK
jgi:nucleoid DNA-binding protein